MKGFDSGKSGQHAPQSEPTGEAELQRSSGLEYPLLTYEGGRIGSGMISGGLGNQSAVEAAKLTDQPQTAS